MTTEGPRHPMGQPGPHRERGYLDPDTGAMLRRARRRSGLTAQQIADAAGIGRPYVFYLERADRRPSWTVAVALADALNLDLTERADLIGQATDTAGRDYTPAT